MAQERNKEKVKQRSGGHRSASSLKQFLDTNEIAARVRQNLGLETVVDKNQSLSSYNAKEIQNLMMDEHENLARDLIQNWSRYQIENRSQLDEIIAMVTNNEYSIYKRAEDGLTIETLADSTQEVSRTKTEVDAGKKKSSRLPFLGG